LLFVGLYVFQQQLLVSFPIERLFSGINTFFIDKFKQWRERIFFRPTRSITRDFRSFGSLDFAQSGSFISLLIKSSVIKSVVSNNSGFLFFPFHYFQS